jgi:hypothetical protein
MWLEAFHLLTSVHHVYTICYLLSIDYTGVTNKYLINMRDMGFRFLTIWNMVSQGFTSRCGTWKLVGGGGVVSRCGTWRGLHFPI